MAKAIAVQIVKDNLAEVIKSVALLTRRQVLIGVPAENAVRDAAKGAEVTNAVIGYAMEFGIPERNVPARPHLAPGIRKVSDRLANLLKPAAMSALSCKPAEIDAAFTKAGIAAVGSVQSVILEGIPPGLAESTLKARARRAGSRKGLKIAKGAIAELAFRAANPGAGASMTATTPLVDSSAYIHSITYVLRNKTATPQVPQIRTVDIEPLTMSNQSTPIDPAGG